MSDFDAHLWPYTGHVAALWGLVAKYVTCDPVRFTHLHKGAREWVVKKETWADLQLTEPPPPSLLHHSNCQAGRTDCAQQCFRQNRPCKQIKRQTSPQTIKLQTHTHHTLHWKTRTQNRLQTAHTHRGDNDHVIVWQVSDAETGRAWPVLVLTIVLNHPLPLPQPTHYFITSLFSCTCTCLLLVFHSSSCQATFVCSHRYRHVCGYTSEGGPQGISDIW